MKREEFVQELTGHIIPFWNKLRDDENGGFPGFMARSSKRSNSLAVRFTSFPLITTRLLSQSILMSPFVTTLSFVSS